MTQLAEDLFVIYRSLEGMFSEPENRVTWLTGKHPVLKCAPLLKILESSAGAHLVRRYLEEKAENGG